MAKIGQVVRLRSGGPDMTVKEDNGEVNVCVWCETVPPPINTPIVMGVPITQIQQNVFYEKEFRAETLVIISNPT
jgi:uncharacterized protein YodC (DUF2158 family)